MSFFGSVRRSGAALGLILTLIGAPLSAETLATPTGEAVLTISGQVAITNQDGVAVLDRAMLEALSPTTFTTTTIWTEGTQSFVGVSLAAFLSEVGVSEGNLKATAINDYAVEIPVSDAVDGGPIIAYMRNGKSMSVRDKGPLWIVYPYDAVPGYQSEVIYSRSIWQLDRIEVID